MNRLFPFVAAAGFAAMFAAFSPAALASAWDKRTYVTFSQSVEVPGAVLEPGRYIMKLVDSPATRNIVQFTNERENHVYATAIAINAYRAEPSDRTLITFYEAPAGQPEAMKTWFYPGDQYGQEFIYPKGHLPLFAKASYQPPSEPAPLVSATPAPPENTSTEPSVAAQSTSAPASTAAVNAAPDPPPSAPPAPVEIAQATPPSSANTPVEVEHNSTPAADTTLPKTASETYTLALIGLIALGGAAALRKSASSGDGSGS